MQNKQIPLFVSSDPANGALNTSATQDRFGVQFHETIVFPPQAENITLEVVQAGIWWTVRNIKTGVNDAFRFIHSVTGTYDIVIAPGLYDIAALSSAINRGLVNAGLASGQLSLTGNNSTGKVILTLNFALLRVEWVPNSFYELVGFNSGQFVPAGGFTTAEYSEAGPDIANFSDVSSFLLHSDLVQGGIPIGSSLSQSIAQVQINVPPGSLINYSPSNPIQLNVNHLRGQLINSASFWVTDQQNRAVDFGGEYFDLLVVIRYFLDEQRVTHI